MNNKNIAIATVLFIVLVIGLFGYTWYQQSQLDAEPVEEPVTNGDQADAGDQGRLSYIDQINAKHFFIDGTHTVVGQLTMPTPCDLLEHEVMVAESYPEQITINFTVLNNADTCAQVMTEQRFMVEVTASEEATFSATLEGRPVDLNLVPAAEGETPEDFELYYKG